jgi:hypothetical protein
MVEFDVHSLAIAQNPHFFEFTTQQELAFFAVVLIRLLVLFHSWEHIIVR